MSDNLAIAGTRKAVKELVDGTLRIQIDIEPRHKAQFHKLFPDIDMDVAIAPLDLKQLPEQDESWPGDITHTSGKAVDTVRARMYGDSEPVAIGQIISDPRLHDYGQQARELRQSDFFRRPEVWRAVGTDDEFLAWIRKQPCAWDGKQCLADGNPVIAAHNRRVANGSGTGIKPPYSAIPLCYKRHQAQTDHGYSAVGGRDWWDKKRIEYLQQWCWETLKAKLGYDSWKQVPPWKLKEWALEHDLERFIPNNYYSSLEET